MALCNRILAQEAFRQLRFTSNFRTLSRLVKTDHLRVYKVENTYGSEQSIAADAISSNLRKQFIRSLNVFGGFSFIQKFLGLNMSGVVENSEITKVDASAKKITPPAEVRGMKKLDRTLFSTDIQVLGVKVPVSEVASCGKQFKKSFLKMPKIQPIADLGESDSERLTHKLFLFDPARFDSLKDFSEAEQEFLISKSVDLNSCKLYNLTLTYENWMYDEVLDAVLPENSEGVGGFSVVGHIAHLNLRENLLEYKHLIGEVLVDKISAVKMVVNKVNIIDNTFRNFEMEVLAGEENFITVAKEHGFSYEFDFSKVYWNSRLGTEHQRIVECLKRGDVVYDMFAGVGPFAIPAAKKNCLVYANDLNPESYRWLGRNVKLNKVKGEIHLYNLDGREFVKSVVKKSLLDLWNSNQDGLQHRNFHIVMNLPAIAIEFLDAFRGLFSVDELQSIGVLDKKDVVLPTIHCYCFSRSENVVDDAKQRTEAVIGRSLPENCTVRVVRNVAPNKEMLCVSFRMPYEVLVESSDKDCDTNSEEPALKKCRLAVGGQD